jgi:hypothetical protein
MERTDGSGRRCWQEMQAGAAGCCWQELLAVLAVAGAGRSCWQELAGAVGRIWQELLAVLLHHKCWAEAPSSTGVQGRGAQRLHRCWAEMRAMLLQVVEGAPLHVFA